jgi:hypothetical protein
MKEKHFRIPLENKYDTPEKKNIAVADSTINGVRKMTKAISGIKDENNPPELLEIRQQENLRGKIYWCPRERLGTEVKILEFLATDLSSDAKGVVNLYTENAPCSSCSSVISQFEAAFPRY